MEASRASETPAAEELCGPFNGRPDLNVTPFWHFPEFATPYATMINTVIELVGVGNPILDKLARVPDTFIDEVGGEKGGMVLTDADSLAGWMARLPEAPVQAPGGSAGNTTFAAAQLGLRTSFIGKVGDDPEAAYYRDRFTDIGGDPSRFKLGNVPTGQCLSLITPDSERTMRTCLGAAATLSPEEITTKDFIGCSHAHIEGYLLFNEALMLKVLQSAKEASCTISLDLASFEVVKAAAGILPDLLRTYVDLVFANEEEAASFLGREEDEASMAEALATFCELAVVKGGARGAWIVRGAERIHAPAIPDVTPIDTTGAGDYWAAGFLAGWLKGKPLETCGAMGSRLGGSIVQVIGAQLPDEHWDAIRSQFP